MAVVERYLLLGQEALWRECKAHWELFTRSCLLGHAAFQCVSRSLCRSWGNTAGANICLDLRGASSLFFPLQS